MKELSELGFIKIGHWKLKNNELQFEIKRYGSESNLIYSFVCDDRIKYIGKTVQTIYQRLNGYKNPGNSQRTNIRINNLIHNTLSRGNKVDIYIFIDNARLKYGNMKINLAAGIEDSLISEFSPNWNIFGKTARKVKYKNIPANQINNELGDTFTIVIGKAYYYDGFFNVRVKYSELFGHDLTKIRIQLGENTNNLIEGYVNRTANRNGTPRIMAGKEYKHWIQKNFKQGDIFKVMIIKQDFIKLLK